MYKIIDARGRSCPEPVVMTKQAIENFVEEGLQVLVDSMVAVENIRRFVLNQGLHVDIEESGDGYALLIKK
ncbi:sulfurtransferase TusA family protein [Natronincola ferrireducens]|uniref:TusA-related sulfurtransferase n=1 Tax=Natronincola ferrireducens TaxID=393762 RepID=A0A1G8ZZG3_9FIRM|nr:sulfurtransferase TusA family protein [Natronincola ferrireducens]SDK19725.1 TusA-related sulfurtransferase [Natronincola ferrireducens]